MHIFSYTFSWTLFPHYPSRQSAHKNQLNSHMLTPASDIQAVTPRKTCVRFWMLNHSKSNLRILQWMMFKHVNFELDVAHKHLKIRGISTMFGDVGFTWSDVWNLIGFCLHIFKKVKNGWLVRKNSGMSERITSKNIKEKKETRKPRMELEKASTAQSTVKKRKDGLKHEDKQNSWDTCAGQHK